MAIFRARIDVSGVEEVTSSSWRLSGQIVDPTGSFSALDVSVEDKILMRGVTATGVVVFDRLKVTSVESGDPIEIKIIVESDFGGGFLRADGYPGTGSFPIGSKMWFEYLTLKPSFFAHQFDPDYDAAWDNLNFEELQNVTANSGFMDGAKQTGVDSGNQYDLSFTDDYLYICVFPGIAGVAIWKKLPLIAT